MDLQSIGITPQKQKQFNAKGIDSVEALAEYLPHKYKDFTHVTGVRPADEVSCVILRVEQIKTFYNKTTMVMAYCTLVSDEYEQPLFHGPKVHVQWFNQAWMANKLRSVTGRNVYCAGKMIWNEQYRNYTISSPDLFEPNIKEGMKMYPVYKKIPGMSNEYLTESIRQALSTTAGTAETLPLDVLKAQGQITKKEALTLLHFPRSQHDVETGQERMIFDDLLYFALHNEWAARNSAKGSPFGIKTLRSYHAIRDALPFTLTTDQSTTIDNMIQHIRSGLRLNALLQGDVGCGKSIVAFCVMGMIADSGYQSVLMAPTQVLARQHYEDLQRIMAPVGHKVVYLGGGEMSAAERREVLKAIKTGEASIVIGTHAVLSAKVEYNNLALVIADEEHRFGVVQRSTLIQRAQTGVHSITMSATPIPRSLAQVVYGDAVQLYTIRTMPNGRKPVKTGISKGRDKVYDFIIRQTQKGRQTYVVCPMIDKNEDMEGVKSVEEVAAEYTAALAPHGVRIATLTGRDKKEHTEDVITRFRAGEIDVLIATTVIEVGVNVPNASTIVITNAERFGLSTLHQLRGRVGRSSTQSYCVLESDAQTETGRQRLEVMCKTTDGFQIAEADLKIRGAGDFIGTQQSGDNKYMSLMLAYPEKYKLARTIASELFDRGDDCCTMVKMVAEQERENV